MKKFKSYKKTKYMEENKNYFKNNHKFSINTSLQNIAVDEMERFLNENYNNLVVLESKETIFPVNACSLISSDKSLLKSLEIYFNMTASTVYGYIKIKDDAIYKFTQKEIDLALNQNRYFSNHHAWIEFENGQLLDLNFVNSFKNANKIEYNEYEFILTKASNVLVPHILSKFSKTRFFNYEPLFYGDLFTKDLILKNSFYSLQFVS